MRILRPLFTLALSIIFSACAHISNAPTELEGIYLLQSLGDSPLPQNSTVFMRIAGDSISGGGPVNQWSALLVEGKVSELISTHKAGPQELMRVESQLFTALEGAKLKADGPTGVRLTKGLETVAKFQRLVISKQSN